MKEENDGVLLRRVLEGETRVYARLVERYRERLGRYALRMLGNQADADDALQDTFIRAYRSLSRCNGSDGFGPWVFGILVNRCRTYAARRALTEGIMVRSEVALATASVESSEGRDTLRDAIQRALRQLPPEQREAFLLKHVDDLSYETMETVTGVRSATLRMRVFRARDELRKLLAEMVRD
ncbi:MAG TPA: RNA polymerase sigma factor [Gemmatimonadales bacterium]